MSDCTDWSLCECCKRWPIFFYCLDLYFLIILIRYLTNLRRWSRSRVSWLRRRSDNIFQLSPSLVIFNSRKLRRWINLFALLNAERMDAMTCKYLLPGCFGVRPVNCQAGADSIPSVPYFGRLLWGAEKTAWDSAVEEWLSKWRFVSEDSLEYNLHFVSEDSLE